MPLVKTEELPLNIEQDVVLARQAVRRLTQELKFSLVEQTKMVTAASELARNTVIYGGGGKMLCEIHSLGLRMGLTLIFEDQGPGIANLELAMTDGWTSGSGMGMGLSGAKRLVNDFVITTEPGKGTRIAITRWK